MSGNYRNCSLGSGHYRMLFVLVDLNSYCLSNSKVEVGGYLDVTGTVECSAVIR